MESLSNEVRSTSGSNVSWNLLEHHPPRPQEHPETNENALEAPTDLSEPTFSSLGPTSNVNLILDPNVNLLLDLKAPLSFG
jgi:hypothetical protein